VLAVLGCIVVLAVIGLGFYGIKSKTHRVLIKAGLWRLVTFSIEIGQPATDKPEELRELGAGRAGPRELEAGPSTEPAGQDNAAALRGPRKPGRPARYRPAQRAVYPAVLRGFLSRAPTGRPTCLPAARARSIPAFVFLERWSD
jgi:hypothetical protein